MLFFPLRTCSQSLSADIQIIHQNPKLASNMHQSSASSFQILTLQVSITTPDFYFHIYLFIYLFIVGTDLGLREEFP